VLSQEIAIQLLNLGHQIRVESSDLDSSRTKPEFSAPANPVIRTQRTDDNTLDAALDNSIGAGDLGMVAGGAGLKSREEGRARQGLVGQFPFEQRELSMLSLPEFSSKRLAHDNAVSRDDRTDSWRDPARHRNTVTCKFYRSEHQRAGAYAWRQAARASRAGHVL